MFYTLFGLFALLVSTFSYRRNDSEIAKILEISIGMSGLLLIAIGVLG
jgi:Ca2+/Na+ antiporter